MINDNWWEPKNLQNIEKKIAFENNLTKLDPNTDFGSYMTLILLSELIP